MRKVSGIEAHKLFFRLHTRMIVRDGNDAFMGSQSLRTAELDARREIGLIFHEPKITARLMEVFEEDWTRSASQKDSEAGDAAAKPPPARKVAKKVAKTVVKVMPPVTPVLEVVVRELAGADTEVDIDSDELEATVREAVKSAIQDAVAGAVEEASKNPE
jgi:hypothetical protein